MEQKKYDLDFKEALGIVLNGGAVKGENFMDGIFLKLNDYGQLVIVNAKRMYEECEKVYITSLNRQMFRELTVLTIKELSC